MSSEYGWKTEYIWTRTSREIAWRIDAINEREKKNIDFELQLNGFKPIFKDTAKVETSPELDAAINKRFEQLKNERTKGWPKN